MSNNLNIPRKMHTNDSSASCSLNAPRLEQCDFATNHFERSDFRRDVLLSAVQHVAQTIS